MTVSEMANQCDHKINIVSFTVNFTVNNKFRFHSNVPKRYPKRAQVYSHDCVFIFTGHHFKTTEIGIYVFVCMFL